MTAIAYRDGIMAADNVAWVANGRIKMPTFQKIERLPDGSLIACMGAVSEIQTVTDWLRRGEPIGRPLLDKDEGFGCLRITPERQARYANWRLDFYDLYGDFHAVGAPAEFMFGALFAGASAEEAVRLAIQHTDGAGGEVQVERL